MEIPFTVLIVNSATKNNVTYYLLQIQQDDDEEMSYAVDRRYTDFVELDEKLRSIYGSYIMDQLPHLPKKTFMRQSSDSFVKKRHYFLQQFLNGIHEIPFLVQSKTYRNFLKMDAFFPASIPIRPFLKFVQNKAQHGIRLSNFNMIMLSHNVFISISGCHPEIAFCSPEKIQSIQNRINQSHQSRQSQIKKKEKLHSYGVGGGKKGKNKYLNASDSVSMSSSAPTSPMAGLGSMSPNSPLTGRIGNDLTNSPSSSMLPSPNEWGGCIQIWYYDTTAMNTSSGNFSWWLEERGDDNKNFYGWNQSQNNNGSSTSTSNAKKSLYDEYNKEQTMDYYSYYGGADDLPQPQHEIQTQISDCHPNPNPNLDKNNRRKPVKRKRMKEVNRELDCIFLNEVPTSLYYDREHQQLFVGTLMGNIHRFKIIHNQKIEATGILPNPNIYNNVSNIHSYCHSSIYTYIHHQQFAKDLNRIENKQRIHQRLYEQRELLKLKERQIHHKKAKRKMALIPDNDAIYNKAILNMVSYGGVLYVSDACSNIHAFDINEFKHLHYISLDHYFVDILQTEYKVHVDEYYKKRLKQYRAQHERMMFKSNEPKDIHSDPIDPIRNKNSLDEGYYGDDHHDNYNFYDNNVLTNIGHHGFDDDDNNDNGGDVGGGLFSASFLKNRNKNKNEFGDYDDDEHATELKSYGIGKEHGNTLSVPMRIGGVEADTAYEMYFDELVFSTTITKQKEKILNVTNKLNQDIIVTDLIGFEDNLFIPTNLPYLALEHLRYPDSFNMSRPKISIDAVLETKLKNDAIIVDEKDKETQDIANNKQYDDGMSYSNPYKGQKRKKGDEWEVIPSKQDQEGTGCDNIFGTVSNFDANNDVLYSIPTIHTIHKDFLIYDDERIRASAHRQDNTNDMSVYNQCTIFVWSFTTHISVDINSIDDEENDEQEQIKYANYESWYDMKQKKKTNKKKKLKKKKGQMIKDRTWHLKAKWYDKTVDHICKEFNALTYCQGIRTLAVGGSTGYVALFNSIGTCFNIFCAHTDTITKMIWLDDSKQLVTTGLDGTIKIWNLFHAHHVKDNTKNKNVLKDDINYTVPLKIEKDKYQETTTNQMISHPPPSKLQSNVQYLNKTKQRTPDAMPPYKDAEPYGAEQDIDRYEDFPELKINDDADLAFLSKSKADNIDYDPFGDKAFDDYLDKRGQSLKKKEQTFYKPPKPQKQNVSSKELLAKQTIFNQESHDSNTPPPTRSKPKTGFKTMKVKTTHKLKTSSPKTNAPPDVDEMADIESYILQQQQQDNDGNAPMVIEERERDNNILSLSGNLNSSIPFQSDNSPDPGTPHDVIDHESSPEPQRNSSFHVVKKTKPKRKKKKDKKDKRDKRDKKKDKKDKKDKKKKKRKKQNNKSLEPEDCTIRYENEPTYKDRMKQKLYSGAAMLRGNKEQETTTNPFDVIDDNDNNNNDTINPFDQQSTNPFAENTQNVETTNPFSQNDSIKKTKSTKSTNPFFADGDLP